jgi:2-deoxy-D-gluconate 3-dehydrogenase
VGRLDGQVAIVTGAGSGIGRATAVMLAAEGATVVAVGRRQGPLDALVAETARRGGRADAWSADVGDPDQAVQLARATVERHGRVDILVNNAGWTGTGPALDVTEEEFDKTVAASFKSVFFACQAAARVMIPQGRGKIINIGSNFGIVAFQGRAAYAGVKAGVHHLSRALSLEWAKHGVSVNVVAPCITETESRKVILERPGYKEWATTQMLPAGRWNQPEDLVGAVLFLSSHLSDMVVGHVLMVDGGWTIH